MKEIKDLTFEFIKATEDAAIASYNWIGSAKEKSADAAATDAMRGAFNKIAMNGVVVIGEGERDEAPMLFIGEEVGLRENGMIGVDIALDPLEGTTLCALNKPNSLTLAAFGEKGKFLNSPDVYMEKIAASGIELKDISFDMSVQENVKSVAKSKGKKIEDMVICTLNRERHQYIIDAVIEIGAKLKIIDDGDVQACIATSIENSGIDMFIGSGGAPEGVLTAAALGCVGGHIIGKLTFRNDDEIKRAHNCGITDLDKVYTTSDLAHGDVVFCASGVTDGAMVSGVKVDEKFVHVETFVLCSQNNSTRFIKTKYDIDSKKHLLGK